MMITYEYGNPSSSNVIIQMADDHDLALMENEAALINSMCDKDFRLLAVKVNNWNHDLSPWEAPAVFGNEAFGDGAAGTLEEVMKLCADREKTYYIGGYSLAALFALWTACQTDLFFGVAAASPSIWFPGFMDFLEAHEIKTKIVYLSLGDREEKTRNPVMAEAGNCIRSAHELLVRKGIRCNLEWNKGNHFKDPDLRTAKAFAWVVNQGGHRKYD